MLRSRGSSDGEYTAAEGPGRGPRRSLQRAIELGAVAMEASISQQIGAPRRIARQDRGFGGEAVERKQKSQKPLREALG